MASKSSIEWTDSTWNPVRGCSRVSPGCLNCYAEKVATRFSDEGQPFHLFAARTPKPHWTGKVELVEEHLADPLKWRKPRRIFVNSMSDLFHEALPDEAIDRVFAVMALAPQHTYQILTKRPERMLAYLSHEDVDQRIAEEIERRNWAYPDEAVFDARECKLDHWPLPSVWLGVSVENQETADARISLLLQTPATIRFVSYEPALRPVTFFDTSEGALRGPGVVISGGINNGTPDSPAEGYDDSYSGLDWIIVGGESGPGARPFDIGWARNVIEQCRAAGVACFVKQLGAQPDDYTDGEWQRIRLSDRKGGDWSEWPADLRVREFPEVAR